MDRRERASVAMTVVDLDTYRPVAQLDHSAGMGCHFADFSSDGQRLVISNLASGLCAIWDVKTWNLAARLLEKEQDISEATFSPDGNSVLTAAEDGALHLWRKK